MLLFKACTRCHGDMHINGDFYGDYKECLQCGLMIDIEKDGDGLMAMMARPNDAETKRAKKKVA